MKLPPMQLILRQRQIFIIPASVNTYPWSVFIFVVPMVKIIQIGIALSVPKRTSMG